MQTRINVDGRITPPEEAVIRVLDRGFLYGDSVYEVLWWHLGVLIQQQEHFERLRESGRRVYMDIDVSDEDLMRAVERTCDAAGVGPEEDAYVRLVVTRGSGSLGLEFAARERQTVVVVVAPARTPTRERWERGLRAAVVHRRRNPRDALDPRAKTGNYLNNVLALHEARLAGADDAIMLNEAGEVAEATTSNVYLMQDGRLVTPPLEAGILKGTSRTRILALCQAHDVESLEKAVPLDDLYAADEVFVSSSVRGILPIVEIDGRPIGNGRPGPWARSLCAWFEVAADEEARRAARHVRTDGDRHPDVPEEVSDAFPRHDTP